MFREETRSSGYRRCGSRAGSPPESTNEIIEFQMFRTAALGVCLLLLGSSGRKHHRHGEGPNGGVVVGATVVATNSAQGIQTKAVTDDHGQYAFPSLAVGTYELEFQSPGFRPFKRDGIVINADSALKEDATLELAQQSRGNQRYRQPNQTQVETESTQVGEVVTRHR